jgi:hypothetical protein
VSYYTDDRVTLYHGDCIEVMRTLPDASVDAVVTDPPYGLEFMGKDWDAPWKQAGDVIADPATVGGFQDGAGGNPFSRSRIRYGREDGASVGFQLWFTDVAGTLKSVAVAPAEIEGAFTRMGVQTKDQLAQAAANAKRDFDLINGSGQATAAGVQTAFKAMAEAAIAAQQKPEAAATQQEQAIAPAPAAEPLQAPTIETAPELLTAAFECTGTREQLLGLGEYMRNNKKTYKNI